MMSTMMKKTGSCSRRWRIQSQPFFCTGCWTIPVGVGLMDKLQGV